MTTIENGSHASLTDVLIIGAGPSGLMAAQALARLNVKTRIVDRRQVHGATPSEDYGAQYGNADGLQPRTLEIWQSYGMLEKFSPKAAPMHAMVCYEQGENGEGLRRSTPSRNVVVNSRYPYELTASIDTIEETLRNSLAHAGGHVTQPALPLSIEVLPEEKGTAEALSHPVKVVLTHLPPGQGFPPCKKVANTNGHAGGGDPSRLEPEVVWAKYVIGADGAHSWIRRQLDIPMEGDQTEYIWGVADVTVDTDFPDCRFKCVIQASTGAVIIIPREDEKIRIYVQLSAQDVTTSGGRLDKSMLSPEIMQAKVLKRAEEGLKPYKLNVQHVFWSTIFSVPQMVAAHFSFRNRVFIVGDACHTHSPKAGQGANASMGDSHNLAWKLSHVLQGWAGKSLLDTYGIERGKYARDLIEFDGRISKSLVGKTAADYQSMLHEQNMFTSGIGIRYQSRLTDPNKSNLASNLTAGTRLAPSPLIRLGDWQPVELQDLAPSDGLFKLFILPCDVLLESQSARLASFAAALGQASYVEWTKRLASFVILGNAKEDVHWKDVPPLFQSWKRVFVSSEERNDGGLYRSFGIASEGAVLLVRPDGYISMIAELSDVGAERVVAFLRDL